MSYLPYVLNPSYFLSLRRGSSAQVLAEALKYLHYSLPLSIQPLQESEILDQ